MSKNTVLVTGGAGYIGSHACKALASAGYFPVVYDNLSRGHEWAVKWGPLVHGDILDRDRLGEVLKTYKPNAVIHFAALAYVGESMLDPGTYYRNNVVGSLNLLEAMRDYHIGVLVFSSSCATYGVPKRLPIQEDSPQRPINPYGASKLMVERMIEHFGNAHGLAWIALRYFNAAGADSNNEIGEEHEPETHLIPLVLDAASGRRRNVTILGTDYYTPDGTCVRDYIHVADLAEAHVMALKALIDGAQSSPYNIGSGRGYSVREIISAVERVTGLKVPVSTGKRRDGDPPALVSDATKAREILSWQPKQSDIDQIVRTAWAWHQRARSPSRDQG